jgi:CBS domain containing-hemolysin-like protein
MIYIFLIAIIIFCLVSEGFFSGSEIALISANKVNLQQLSHHSIGARLALILLKEPEKLLSTTLVGTNTMTIASSFAANELFARIWGSKYSVYSVFVIIPAILIIGEIIPKAIFRLNADKISIKVAYPLRIAMVLFYPVVYPTIRLIGFLRVKVITAKKKATPYVTKKELKLILKSEQKQVKSHNSQAKMIYRLLDYANTRVGSIMTPLFKEIRLSNNASIREAVYSMQRTKLEKIAVYRKRSDNIIGFIHSQDLLNLSSEGGKIKYYIRNALYVPELMRISQLLKLFREKEIDVAVVIDEYGSTVGLVHLKEILGEILSKSLSTRERPQLKKLIPLGHNIYLADAELKLDRLTEALDIELEWIGEETLGGYLLHLAQKIPRIGEEFVAYPLKIKVLTGTPKKVEKLRLEVLHK